ncbi:hypothetical protein ACIBCO_41040 [Streptomyces violascens]|uniref:hypothetical protein n=1 Tax=Streptomyces violascens TaxID=67381 RepID=UPI00379B5827
MIEQQYQRVQPGAWPRLRCHDIYLGTHGNTDRSVDEVPRSGRDYCLHLQVVPALQTVKHRPKLPHGQDSSLTLTVLLR